MTEPADFLFPKSEVVGIASNKLTQILFDELDLSPFSLFGRGTQRYLLERGCLFSHVELVQEYSEELKLPQQKPLQLVIKGLLLVFIEEYLVEELHDLDLKEQIEFQFGVVGVFVREVVSEGQNLEDVAALESVFDVRAQDVLGFLEVVPSEQHHIQSLDMVEYRLDMRLSQQPQVQLEHVLGEVADHPLLGNIVYDKHELPEGADIEQPEKQLFDGLIDGLAVGGTDSLEQPHRQKVVLPLPNNFIHEGLEVHFYEVEALLVIVLEVLDEDVGLAQLNLALVDKLQQEWQLVLDGFLCLAAIQDVHVKEIKACLEQVED